MKAKHGRTHYIQCTTWRDKKQVCFLHSGEIGRSNGLSVLRHVKGKQMRVRINGPRAQAEYATYFNAVDCNDRDSADFSTTIRSNRYYLRIFCWILDRVVHTIYVVVCWCSEEHVTKRQWKRYKNHRQEGRRDFQIDLGLELLNTAISWDWTGDERPKWVRQGPLIPCGCEACYFCLNGYTNGIAHKGKRKDPVDINYKCGCRMRTTECTNERVNIKKGCKYCKMCYRINKEGTSDERKDACNVSRLGCPRSKRRDRCVSRF